MTEPNALSQRATWILCAGPRCASLYRIRSLEDKVGFIRSISAPEGGTGRSNGEWIAYLADELDVLCGAGTNNRLVVCSPPGFRARLMRKLDDLTRECVEGTVDTDFGCTPTPEELHEAVAPLLPSEKAGRAA